MNSKIKEELAKASQCSWLLVADIESALKAANSSDNRLAAMVVLQILGEARVIHAKIAELETAMEGGE